MKVQINEKRKVFISEKDNTQNENKVTELTLELPQEYENWNKRIVFITDDGVFWDYIQDNTYLIKKNVTHIYSEDEIPAEMDLTYYKDTETIINDLITRVEVLESEV